MSNLIKKFNVTINGDSATYEVGADAKNVQFSNEATSPFKNETVEDNVPVGIVEKAENRIYGNAYIKNNNTNIEGRPEDFGPIDDIQTDRTNEGAGALTITYGFNSLAKGHHSTAIGFDCVAAGWASHAEGWKTATAQGTNYSHAEGAKTEANHNAAHAEGDAAKAYGYGSHAEGRGTYVYGVGSHAEGMTSNIGQADKVAWQNSNALHGFIYDDPVKKDASNNDVDVELTYPKQIINGQLSHAEGLDNNIYGACCHAEGMHNTIHKVYASTAMGEENNIYSSASVAMGYKNTLNAGSNNSLILGNNNVNPGYPNSLFLGQYCAIETGGSEQPALVIGSGNDQQASNLLTIRHPQAGIATPENRGSIWANQTDAYFGRVNTIKYDLPTFPFSSGSNNEQYDMWTYSIERLGTTSLKRVVNDNANVHPTTTLVTDEITAPRQLYIIRARIKTSAFSSTNEDWKYYEVPTAQIAFIWDDTDQQRRCIANSSLVIVHRQQGIIEAFFTLTDDYYYYNHANRLTGYLSRPTWETQPNKVYLLAHYSAI